MSQKLFDYMLKQHDVILLDTDMHEIELICNRELIEENKKLELRIQFLEGPKGCHDWADEYYKEDQINKLKNES